MCIIIVYRDKKLNETFLIERVTSKSEKRHRRSEGVVQSRRDLYSVVWAAVLS